MKPLMAYLNVLGQQLNVEIHTQREEIFDAMRRV